MKFCIVAQKIYPILVKKNEFRQIGGAELQQSYIGTGLAGKGLQVQFITQDFGQKSIERVNNIAIFKTFKENSGMPVLRFIYPRLYKIWQALKKSDADVYYTRSAGFMVGVIAYFCRRYGKKFIYAGAHDTDFIPGKHIIKLKRDVLLYHYGLANCDKVIVQSFLQQNLLKQNFGITGQVIRNLSLEPLVELVEKDQHYILWVATIREWKRPEFFIHLAKKFPTEKFIMIGGEDFQTPYLYKKVQNLCDDFNNINFLGFQPFEDTEKYFDHCKVFINTSIYEGFPNTFLQAWRRGIPVISFVDPDDVIQDNNLGIVVSSSEQMEISLRQLLSSPANFDYDCIRNYFFRNHSSAILDEYEKIIKELTS